MSEIRECIERGHKWLLESYPNYLNNVNLDTLDMSLSHKCITAQAAGENIYAKLPLSLQERGDMGFTSMDKSWFPGDLTREWKSFLKDLLSAKANSAQVTITILPLEIAFLEGMEAKCRDRCFVLTEQQFLRLLEWKNKQEK